MIGHESTVEISMRSMFVSSLAAAVLVTGSMCGIAFTSMTLPDDLLIRAQAEQGQRPQKRARTGTSEQQLLQNPMVQQMLRDPDLQRQIMDDPRFEGLMQDPQVQRLMQSPQVQRQMQQNQQLRQMYELQRRPLPGVGDDDD
jgi:regulator of sirC expression with transglutaminase-like and TPR domain